MQQFVSIGQNNNYTKWLSYFVVLGNDSLTKSNFKNILHNKFFDRQSKFFDIYFYNKIKRYLLPPKHLSEQGKEIIYTLQQKTLIVSEPGDQKIKGVAGCGKTLVLAKRAVNAYLRTRGNILIVTFNITLRNYIHDKLSEVREDYDWNSFTILHYHEFFYSQANNHNINVPGIESFEDTNFFESVNENFLKFDAIFIDEGQDYKYEWFIILKKYFLKRNGEFVIFADEKQNIYERELDKDKKTRTNIVGRWNEQLKSTQRLSKPIIRLANQFQKEFWRNKYIFDDIKYDTSQQEIFVEETLNYEFYEGEVTIDPIIKHIYKKLNDDNIHPNDVGILGPDMNLMREIDFLIRNEKKEKTNTMFETQEIYDFISESLKKKYEKEEKFKSSLQDALERVRRSKKFNFWMNPGTIKISTIHSFKGWEIDTLFLIIPNNLIEKNISLDELVYTGITRARRNLYVINLGNYKYHKFFNKELNQLKHENNLETLTISV